MNGQDDWYLLGLISTTGVVMFGLFKGRLDSLVAHDGRVACPSRGVDTEIDLCFDCPRMREIVQEQDATWVRCQPLRQRHDGSGYWTSRPDTR